MTREEINRKVVEVVSETLALPTEHVTMKLAIGDIPQWNSMANMAIITAVEETLGIEIPSEDLFELTSVESIVEEVAKVKGL